MEKQDTPKKKRIRLTPKQTRFLIEVLNGGYSVEDTMDKLNIWPRLLYRWLQQPHFQEAIELKLAQFHLQARIDAARAAPGAIHTLTYMGNHHAKYETLRKASVDLLTIQNKLNPKNKGAALAKSGAPVAKTGDSLAQSGESLAQTGARRRAKNAPNPHSERRNAQNIKFPLTLIKNNRFGNNEN